MDRLHAPKSECRRASAVRRRLGRTASKLHGIAYALVAAGAMAAAGLQPPHTAAVEVGTVMVATSAGADLVSWPAMAPVTGR